MVEGELPLALPNLDDPFAAARADIDARLAQFLKGADVWETREELTEDLARRANDFITGAKRLAKEAEEARVAEKAPHLAAAKAVDVSWEAIQSRIAKVIGLVASKLERYLNAKAERERLAREQAEREQREAEEARRAAEAEAAAAETASERIEAEERAAGQARIAEEAGDQAARLSAPTRVDSATGLANRRGLKTSWEPRIASLAQALQHYRAEPELLELLLKFAARDLRKAPVKRGVKQIPRIPGIAFDQRKGLA